MRLFISTFFILICLAPTNMRGTHIVGGEMNYTCLGNDRYAIELTVYRDCENGVPYFDIPGYIGIFGEEDTLLSDLPSGGLLSLRPMGDDTLNPVLENACLLVPPTVCVHTTTYRDTITLPFREGGYQLVYQRCCRNMTIQNLVDPDSTGATYLVELSERSLLECNSNAKFKEWPPIYICADLPLEFDHSATDIDGDSLVYRLCTPLQGATPSTPRPVPPGSPPYEEVVWLDPPYNLENLLGGVPLEIDPQTGLMTAVPNTLGQFVVGVCVDEYRDGELISTTRRDFQYNVGVCGVFSASFFTPSQVCSGKDVLLENTSEAADEAIWKVNGPGYVDSILRDFDLVLENAIAGKYQIELVAIKDGSCADTFSREVVVDSTLVDARADVSWEECGDSVLLELDNRSISNDTGLIRDTIWELYVNDSLQSQSPPFYVKDTGEIAVLLRLIGSNGCPDKDTVRFSSPFFDPGLPDRFSTCDNESVALNPDSLESDADYFWSPDSLFSDPHSLNPVLHLNESAYVYYRVEKEGYCNFTDSIRIQVLSTDLIRLDFDIPDLSCSGDSIFIQNRSLPAGAYQWILRGGSIEDTIYNTTDLVLEGLDSGEYSIALVAFSFPGCSDTLEKKLMIEPMPLMAGFDIEYNCVSRDSALIEMIDLVEGPDTAEYETDYKLLQNGEVLQVNPPFVVPDSGEFLLRQIVTATNGCQDSLTKSYPSPFLDLVFPDSIYYCLNDTLELNPDTSGSGYTFLWTSDNFVILDPTSLNPSLLGEGGSGAVEVEVSGEGICTVMEDIWVEEVNTDSLDPDFLLPEMACINDTLFFENLSGGGVEFQWRLERNGGFPRYFFERDLTLPELRAGSYEIELIAFDEQGCSDTIVKNFQLPTLFVEAGFRADLGVCEDSTEIEIIDESESNEPGEPMIFWQLFDRDSLIDQELPFYFTDQDSLLIVQEVVDSRGCSDLDSQWVYRSLDLGLADTVEICLGDSVTLGPEMSISGEYQWTPTDGLNDASISNPRASPANDQLYVLEVSREGFCTLQDSTFVKVHPNPEILFLEAEEDPVVQGQDHILRYDIMNADSIFWRPEEIVLESGMRQARVNIDGNQQEILLIAVSEFGCNDTTRIVLQRSSVPCEEPYVFIPNAFTPNGDGTNDVFQVRSAILEELHGFVYNQWGERVYTFHAPEDAWDGTVNGQQAPVDAYGYYFEYRCEPGGELHQVKGNVSLIR